MVTREELELFHKELEKQRNIYDLLVLFYLQIEGPDKPRYIEEYYKNQANLKPGYWGDLPLATNEMLSGCITFGGYRKLLQNFIQRENLRNVAIRLLFDFDEYLKERDAYPALSLTTEDFIGKLYILGPLNSVEPEYCFYLMPSDHYFKKYNETEGEKIRFLNQSEFSAIDERIKRYKIMKKDRLDKAVTIKYYPGAPNIQSSYPELKVGIVPVSKNLWCKPVYYEYGEKNYFELEEMEECNEEINKQYLEILKKCINEDIQIVVFPELAVNSQTISIIRDFLIKSSYDRSNSLELVFLGSLWDRGINEGILMSGTGTVLLRSQKMNAFYLKKNGKIYWENLKQEAQNVELIDIPKIGRMQYLVCKDGLNDSWQHRMWDFFEIAFSVISSYSTSISYFEQLGDSFSRQYAGVQVLSNACAPRIKSKAREMESTTNLLKQPFDEIGFLTVPCCKNTKKEAACQKLFYKTMEHCMECSFGGCIRVFKLNPSLAKGEDQTLKTNCQKFISVVK